MGLLDDLRKEKEEWFKSQEKNQDVQQPKTLEELEQEAELIAKQKEEEKKQAEIAILKLEANSRITVNRERAQKALDQLTPGSNWQNLVSSDAPSEKQIRYLAVLKRNLASQCLQRNWLEALDTVNQITTPRSKRVCSRLIDGLLRCGQYQQEEDVIDVLRMVV